MVASNPNPIFARREMSLLRRSFSPCPDRAPPMIKSGVMPKPCSLSPATLLGLAALVVTVAAGPPVNFTFNGFADGQVVLSGAAEILHSRLLRLTNDTQQAAGYAYFPLPLRFDGTGSDTIFSFSSTFVFAILPRHNDSFGDGLTFALSPTSNAPAGGMPGEYFGLFNDSSKAFPSNHIVAAEFDIVYNVDVFDMDNNHVGIDVNGPRSNASHHASYFDDQTNGFKNITLASGEPMQVWIDYDARRRQMNVTISPFGLRKPSIPLVSSSTIDLSSLLSADAYVGFTSSTGTATASHYVAGWSFCLNGEATPLSQSGLPSFPRLPTTKSPKKGSSRATIVGLSLVTGFMILVVGLGLVVILERRRRKFAEVVEDWELEYGVHRFSYKDLYRATKGFHEDNFIGAGGFGRVYRGVLQSSKMDVAVKKISRDSRQGIREFVAEIASVGRLRHRNLVQLLGYCRREGELLLVYDYMPNGSLDKYLFYDEETKKKGTLSWTQRFRIIKGIASGLLYLHEGGDQVVVHRDVKAGNVLLDGEMEGRLSDFGLARLHDHGGNPGTTRVVGTIGYMAPELSTTGKATTASDVYAFGCFLLEITCGRRPMRLADGQEQFLTDWVLELWKIGNLSNVVDPRMARNHAVEEVETVLKLGLLCSHPKPASRPTMKQVVQVLEGDISLPETSPEDLSATFAETRRREGFDEFALSLPLLTDTHILSRRSF